MALTSKLRQTKLAKTINNIGSDDAKELPILIGVAEVENAKVLEDLLDNEHLNDQRYNFVHYDSPDERGIDVALLVNEDVFKIEKTEPIPIEEDFETNEEVF